MSRQTLKPTAFQMAFIRVELCKLSQQEFADALQVSRRTVTRWEGEAPAPGEGDLSVGCLRGRRETAGLSQEQLAISMGVHKATVARWENSGRVPQKKIEQLNKILQDGEAVPHRQLVKLRERAGLSREEAALKLGVPFTRWCSFERGAIPLPDYVLRAFAEIVERKEAARRAGPLEYDDKGFPSVVYRLLSAAECAEYPAEEGTVLEKTLRELEGQTYPERERERYRLYLVRTILTFNGQEVPGAQGKIDEYMREYDKIAQEG